MTIFSIGLWYNYTMKPQINISICLFTTGLPTVIHFYDTTVRFDQWENLLSCKKKKICIWDQMASHNRLNANCNITFMSMYTYSTISTFIYT